MELMKLIGLKQLMELTELLESWLILWIGVYDYIERADGASGLLVEWKGGIYGSDWLVGIDGNYKANGIGTLELTEVAEFME